MLSNSRNVMRYLKEGTPMKHSHSCTQCGTLYPCFLSHQSHEPRPPRCVQCVMADIYGAVSRLEASVLRLKRFLTTPEVGGCGGDKTPRDLLELPEFQRLSDRGQTVKRPCILCGSPQHGANFHFLPLALREEYDPNARAEKGEPK